MKTIIKRLSPYFLGPFDVSVTVFCMLIASSIIGRPSLGINGFVQGQLSFPVEYLGLVIFIFGMLILELHTTRWFAFLTLPLSYYCLSSIGYFLANPDTTASPTIGLCGCIVFIWFINARRPKIQAAAEISKLNSNLKV